MSRGCWSGWTSCFRVALWTLVQVSCSFHTHIRSLPSSFRLSLRPSPPVLAERRLGRHLWNRLRLNQPAIDSGTALSINTRLLTLGNAPRTSTTWFLVAETSRFRLQLNWLRPGIFNQLQPVSTTWRDADLSNAPHLRSAYLYLLEPGLEDLTCILSCPRIPQSCGMRWSLAVVHGPLSGSPYNWDSISRLSQQDINCRKPYNNYVFRSLHVAYQCWDSGRHCSRNPLPRLEDLEVIATHTTPSQLLDRAVRVYSIGNMKQIRKMQTYPTTPLSNSPYWVTEKICASINNSRRWPVIFFERSYRSSFLWVVQISDKDPVQWY